MSERQQEQGLAKAMDKTHSRQYGKRDQNLSRKRKLSNNVNGGDRHIPRTQHQYRQKRRTIHSKSKGSDDTSYKVPVKNTCSVCNIGDPKYKCPKCRSTYCSIVCCRKHKDEFCSLVVESTQSVNDDDTSRKNSQKDPLQTHVRSKYLSEIELMKVRDDNHLTLTELQSKIKDDRYVDAELGLGWKMTNEMILIMNNSTWLRDELADSGLQQLIVKILSSSNNLMHSNRSHRHNGLSSQQNITQREQMLHQLKSNYPQFHSFVDKLLFLTGIYERRIQDETEEKVPTDDWLTNNHVTEFSLKPLPRRVRPVSAPLEVPSSSSKTDSSSSDDDDDDSNDDDDDQ
jgi:zinc finger HIT domain-containing protein 3